MKSTTENGIPTIDLNELSKAKGYRLIDVRRPEEFTGELGHIHGAELVNLETELESFLKRTPPGESIIFICRSGNRSGKATQMALDAGFKDVFNMAGGMLEWNKRQMPLSDK